MSDIAKRTEEDRETATSPNISIHPFCCFFKKKRNKHNLTGSALQSPNAGTLKVVSCNKINGLA